MRKLGLIIVIAAMAVPALWFTDLAGRHKSSAILAQYIGALALIAMAFGQLMATRARFVERLFGGLDRVYLLHKWLGIAALAAILLHDAIGPEVKGLKVRSPLAKLGEELGEVSLDSLLVLVGITLLTFLPYRWWYWSHRLIGLAFALGAAHFLLVAKPFALTDPLGLYLSAFCAIGIVSYLYTVLPFGRSLRRHRYTVASVAPAGDAVAVTLSPLGRGLRHRAGQFAFVGFDVAGLREAHPFTISSAPAADRALRFTIKPLGDYTRRLPGRIAAGQTATVSGPHGAFVRRPGAACEVWIAAGVGVTPFVAWAEALTDDATSIHMFYCVRNAAEAAHLDVLRAAEARHPHFRLHLIESERQGRLTAAAVAASVGQPVAKARIYFCGPKPMREALRSALRSAGVRPGRFHYEEFEIRTGIGLERLLAWLLAMVTGRGRGAREAATGAAAERPHRA